MVIRLLAAAGILVVALFAIFISCKVSGDLQRCRVAADCPSTLPMCDPTSNVCVGCIDSFQTCGPDRDCNQATHTCMPCDPTRRCTRRADCPRVCGDMRDGQLQVTCDVDSGLCAQCISNADCVAPDVCFQSTCGSGCRLCGSAQLCNSDLGACLDLGPATD